AMSIACYPFMVLATIGLLLSFGIHIMALAGLSIPGGRAVWVLHIGIFVVWIPTVWIERGDEGNVPESADAFDEKFEECAWGIAKILHTFTCKITRQFSNDYGA